MLILFVSTPKIIVDIGTATTISVVNENNDYLGGLIAPGPATSMKALSNAASLLPEIELIPTDNRMISNKKTSVLNRRFF